MFFRNRSVLAVSFLALVVAACGRPAREGKDAGCEPAIAVRVQRPDRIQRPVFVAASGTVEATQTANLGFQVAGRVAHVFVEEGQPVRKGQVIAELDAADYQYGLQASEGQAGVAQASLEKAQTGTRPRDMFWKRR